MLKQRFDFVFEKRIETTDRLPIMKAKKIVNQRFDFPFEKGIETTDRLPLIQDEKN